MRRKGGASGRQLSGDFPLPYSGFRASLWQLSVPALWQLSRAAAFWRPLGEVSGSLSARASTRLPAPLIGRPTCFSHGKADRYGTKMARLTAMAVIEADFWSRQAKAKAKGLVAIFSPTRNACFRCHNGQPCHFGATAVGLADPEAQRSALPTRRHSGHARHPQRGRPARKRTLPSPTKLACPESAIRRGRKRPEGRYGPPILAACHPSGGAGRPPGPPPGADAGRHGPARPPLGQPPAVMASRPPLGRPPAVTGSHRPSWAATWERPPRRSPPLRPRPYPWSSLAGTGAAGISTFSTRLMSSCWEWTSSLR